MLHFINVTCFFVYIWQQAMPIENQLQLQNLPIKTFTYILYR